MTTGFSFKFPVSETTDVEATGRPPIRRWPLFKTANSTANSRAPRKKQNAVGSLLSPDIPTPGPKLHGAQLLDLATELLITICHYVETDAERVRTPYDYRRKRILGNLCLVCRRLREIAEPILFSRVTLDFSATPDTANLQRMVQHLDPLVEGKSPACYHAKTLRIISLDPMANISGRSLNEGAIKYAESVRQKVYLPSLAAIRSLRGLSAVFWKIRGDDNELVEVLKVLPHLEELSLEWSPVYSEVPLPDLTGFRHIKKLKISVSKYEPYTRTFLTLPGATKRRFCQLIANSHSLESLDFTGPEAPNFSLSALLSDTTSTNALPLSSLCLSNSLFDINESMIPHLKNLRSLEAHVRRDGSRKPYIAWEILQRHKICLTNLAIDEFSISLLDYLASYNGLQRLSINYEGPAPAKEDIQYFFNTALTYHSESLFDLKIQSRFPNDLCFNQNIADIFSICPRVTDLFVTLEPEGGEYHFKLLIKSITSRKTRLGELGVAIASLDEHDNHMEIRKHIIEEIVSWAITDPHLYPRIIFLEKSTQERLVFPLKRNRNLSVFYQNIYSYRQIPRTDDEDDQWTH